jgi:hypothetical protein
MPKLADVLPTKSKTVEAIYAAYKTKGDAEPPRKYLGCSELGHPCERLLWYKFHIGVKESFDGRMYRLFDTGNHAEARFVADLRAIGCTVHEVGEDGKQFALSAFDGQLSGHMDGCVLGVPEAPKTWHVCEFKTHNNKSFNKLVKDGVAKTKPQHYCQMQMYMGLSGMTRALYLAVNKDNDELYSERVRFNKQEFDALMARADRIIHSTVQPERISEREDYYECSWCPAHSICWNKMLQSAEDVFGATLKKLETGSILEGYKEGEKVVDVKWKGAISSLKAAWNEIYHEDIETLTPVRKYDEFDCQSVEFSGARAVFVWNPSHCEIRECIPF